MWSAAHQVGGCATEETSIVCVDGWTAILNTVCLSVCHWLRIFATVEKSLAAKGGAHRINKSIHVIIHVCAPLPV